MPAIVTLIRRNKPLWDFTWSNKWGYIHNTKNTTYRIFFDNCTKKPKYDLKPHIWIGKLIETKEDGIIWVTCEKEIKAQSLIFFNGQYNFN